MIVKFKFKPGDTVYAIDINEDGDLCISKGTVQEMYVHEDKKLSIYCSEWENEVNESKVFSLDELMKLLPSKLKQMK